MRNKIFLLEKSKVVDWEDREGNYDRDMKINIVETDGAIKPFVSSEMSPATQTKTKAQPGDDDSDPDDERCY